MYYSIWYRSGIYVYVGGDGAMVLVLILGDGRFTHWCDEESVHRSESVCDEESVMKRV